MAASDEKQVGIGTTRPYYKLHVGGGEGNRGGIGATDLTISGIATLGVGNSSQGALNVVGISTFDGDIDLTGSAGVSTVLWDASENRLEFKDNASVGFGTGNDLTLYHDGSSSFIKDTVGDLRISGDKITLELEDGTDVKVIDQYGVNITGVTTTNRLLVSGVSTFTGAIDANSTSDFGGTVTVSSGNVVVSSGNVTLGTGVTVTNAGNIAAAGIVTANGGVYVGTAASIHSNGNASFSGITTVGTALSIGDNKKIQFGNDGDLLIYASGAGSEVLDTSGNLSLRSSTIYVELEGGTNIIKADQFGAYITGVTTTNRLRVSGIATFASDVNVLGNLNVTGDITYDEVTGRNLNITGITTFGGLVNVDAGITANTAIVEDLTNNRVVIAGTGGEIEDDANLTYDGVDLNIGAGTGVTVSNTGNIAAAGIVTANGGVKVGTAATITSTGNFAITGIATANRFIGIHTSADGGGIGIGSTTAHVGYGITYIDFKGPGVSTVYSSSVTGITTIYFQGGGGLSVGAAGTWQNDGAPGISTAKSVGINTVGVAVTALMGGEKGASSGIGASMQGLYIGNGMLINDNALNGNHYIGTAFGGIMAGPVTVNGIITVDGNWAVV